MVACALFSAPDSPPRPPWRPAAAYDVNLRAAAQAGSAGAAAGVGHADARSPCPHAARTAEPRAPADACYSQVTVCEKRDARARHSGSRACQIVAGMRAGRARSWGSPGTSCAGRRSPQMWEIATPATIAACAAPLTSVRRSSLWTRAIELPISGLAPRTAHPRLRFISTMACSQPGAESKSCSVFLT